MGSYPWWGEILGFMISGSSMIWVPAYAIYYLLTTEGTLMERVQKGMVPTIRPRPDAVIAESVRKHTEKPVIGEDDRDVELNLVAGAGEPFTVEASSSKM